MDQWQLNLGFASEGQPFGGFGEEGGLELEVGVGEVGTRLAEGNIRKQLSRFRTGKIEGSGSPHIKRKDFTHFRSVNQNI